MLGGYLYPISPSSKDYHGSDKLWIFAHLGKEAGGMCLPSALFRLIL